MNEVFGEATLYEAVEYLRHCTSTCVMARHARGPMEMRGDDIVSSKIRKPVREGNGG